MSKRNRNYDSEPVIIPDELTEPLSFDEFKRRLLKSKQKSCIGIGRYSMERLFGHRVYTSSFANWNSPTEEELFLSYVEYCDKFHKYVGARITQGYTFGDIYWYRDYVVVSS